MRGVIILGSSRSDGNTRQVVDTLLQELSFDLIDLREKEIAPFDYEYKNQDDDFLPLIKRIVKDYDFLLFATPVYWYSMSGIMKNFFDRFSDCLRIEKEVGRKLRGKTMGMIRCAYDEVTVSGFAQPFAASAAYLGMKYFGDIHTWIKDGEDMDKKVEEEILAFARRIKNFQD